MDTAERQRQYRRDVAAERVRMRSGLNAVLKEIEGRDTPVAIRIRAICEEALR